MKIVLTGNSVPTGLISLWSGLLVDIPTGWELCNGENGKPDLRSKFIMGCPDGDEPTAEGGSNTHVHDQHAGLSHSGSAVAQHAGKDTGSQNTPMMAEMYSITPAGIGVHAHSISAYSHNVTQPSQHAARSHSEEDNVPVYFTLAFIIKV